MWRQCYIYCSVERWIHQSIFIKSLFHSWSLKEWWYKCSTNVFTWEFRRFLLQSRYQRILLSKELLHQLCLLLKPFSPLSKFSNPPIISPTTDLFYTCIFLFQIKEKPCKFMLQTLTSLTFFILIAHTKQ